MNSPDFVYSNLIIANNQPYTTTNAYGYVL